MTTNPTSDPPTARICSVEIRGVGPFTELKTPPLVETTVFVGPNGSGKTSLLSCLRDTLEFYLNGNGLTMGNRKKPKDHYTKIVLEVIGTEGTEEITLTHPARADTAAKKLIQKWIASAGEGQIPLIYHPARRDLQHKSRELQKLNDITSKWQEAYTTTLLRSARSRYEAFFDEVAASVFFEAMENIKARDLHFEGDRTHGRVPFLKRRREEIIKDLSAILGRDIRVVVSPDRSTITLKIYDEDDEDYYDFNVLSDGEKELFILFSDVVSRPAKPIVIIDEPEAHLHPSMQTQLVDTMKKYCSQLILATHSPSIMASCDRGSLFSISRETPKSSRFIVKQVADEKDLLDSLLSKYGGLSEFKTVSQWHREQADSEFYRYLAECLKPGRVLDPTDVKPGDRQMAALIPRLLQHQTVSSVPFRLLDFGGGKGRLLEMFVRSLPEDRKNQALANIDYVLVDSNEVYHTTATELGQKYGIKMETHKAIEQISGSFQAIVCANVIHEVALGNLSHTLHLLLTRLADNGFIYIVDMYDLPEGESSFIAYRSSELANLIEEIFPYVKCSVFEPPPGVYFELCDVAVTRTQAAIDLEKSRVDQAIKTFALTKVRNLSNEIVEIETLAKSAPDDKTRAQLSRRHACRVVNLAHLVSQAKPWL